VRDFNATTIESTSAGGGPCGTPSIWTVRMPCCTSMPARSVPPVKSSAMQAQQNRARRSPRRAQPRRAASIFAMSILPIVIIASNTRLATAGSGSADRGRQGPWRDLPRQAPPVLAPAARAGLAAVPDDRVPQPIGLGLVVGRHLEREGLVVLERRAPVQAEAGDAHHGELDRQDVALLARRKVPRARGKSFPTVLSGNVSA
jgi:hypothetical protein